MAKQKRVSLYQRMMRSVKNNPIEYGWIFSVLIVAVYLRLFRIRDYLTFLGDEGRDVLVIKRMIVDHDITFLGPTASVGGFFLGPIYYYFITPFLWATNLDPVGPAIFVALVGIATVLLIYYVAKMFFDTYTGLIAATLYALSPLVIAYSRSSWNPNVVPFFALLLILSLYKSVTTHSKWWYLLVGICLGVGIQLHYLFTFLFPVALLYILIYDRGVSRIKQYLFALLGSFVVLFPFGLFELKNGFTNTTTIVKFLLAGEEVSVTNPFVIVADVLFRAYGRLVFFFPPPDQIKDGMSALQQVWWVLIIITLVSSIGLLVYRTYRHMRKSDVLLIIWLLFGIGLFALYSDSIYDYYLVIVFPLPFILVSSLLTTLWKIKWAKPIIFIGIIALIWLNWSGRPFVHVPNKQVNQVEIAAKSLFDRTNNEPYNFALMTRSNSDHAYRYFLEIWGNPPVTIENSEVDPERNTVTDQLFVICEYPTCKPVGDPLWEIAGFGQAEIEERWESGPLVLYKLVPYEEPVVQ